MKYRPERFTKELLLLEKIAEGGMAQVYRGKQTGIGGFEKTVAVKRILPEYAEMEEFKAMFLRETQLSAVLQHPNIVQIFSNGIHKGYLYLVMEFVDGKTVSDIQEVADERGVVIPLEVACFLVEEAAKGLGFAHDLRDERTGESYDLVHRDVSPHNVMVSYNGSVKLVDFGIAKAAKSADLTQTGIIKGKEAYLAPELVQGRAASRYSDIFALGIVAYELITGRYLFDEETTLQTLQSIQKCEIPRLIHETDPVDPDLEEIVLTALSRDPEQRYQSALDFARELGTYRRKKYPSFEESDVASFMRALFSDDIASEKHVRDEMSSALYDFLQNEDLDMEVIDDEDGDEGARVDAAKSHTGTVNVQVVIDDDSNEEAEEEAETTYRDRLKQGLFTCFVALSAVFAADYLFPVIFKLLFGYYPVVLWQNFFAHQGIFEPTDFIFRKVFPPIIGYVLMLGLLLTTPVVLLGGMFGRLRLILDFFFTSCSYIVLVFMAVVFYNFFILVQYTEFSIVWFAIAGLVSIHQIVQIAILSPVITTLRREGFQNDVLDLLAGISNPEHIRADLLDQLVQQTVMLEYVTDSWVGLWTLGYTVVLGVTIANTLNLNRKGVLAARAFFVVLVALTLSLAVASVDASTELGFREVFSVELPFPVGVWKLVILTWLLLCGASFALALVFGRKRMVESTPLKRRDKSKKIKVEVMGN